MEIRKIEVDNNPISPSEKGHLVEIVKMRTDALVNYSNRVWKLFNWFQTLNVVILGVILTKQVIIEHSVYLLAIISLLLSILWFFLGVNDFISMEKHKIIKNNLEKDLFIQMDIEEKLQEAVEEKKPKKLIKFNLKQTKALYIVPVFNFLITIIVLVINKLL
jgi:hypothetical protein